VTEERLLMSGKERGRLVVLHQVQAGSLTLREGAEQMGVCYRQGKRIWARFKRQGASGLVHRLRGQVSNRRSDPALRARVLEIYRQHYDDFGPTLAAEKLAERHGVKVSRQALRRWLIEEGLWLGNQRFRKHRRRRRRRQRFGELVQLDGSHHRWFEGRADPCCLMVMVDDASGATMGHFGKQETTVDALVILRKWIERYGVPKALYTDRKTLYVTDREPTEEEKRRGIPPLTDFGRACWRLGIKIIAAHSAQAKGRVERKNGVLQDRLVKELRLERISNIARANEMIDEFTEDLDLRFAVEPGSAVNAHRIAPGKQTLETALAFERIRTVLNDWTITYGSRVYQIDKDTTVPAPRAKVIVRQQLDGAVSILYKDRPLKHTCIKFTTGPNQKVIPPPRGWHANTPQAQPQVQLQAQVQPH
jgi:transposase